jgi:hypothetical protein
VGFGGSAETAGGGAVTVDGVIVVGFGGVLSSHAAKTVVRVRVVRVFETIRE